ncbi:MAG: diguanylate cyclase, partial [Halioglobus sp.]|nr:diguanylate cyclase [Halioglobus sp.]
MMRWLWSLRYRNLPLDQTTTLARAGGKRVLINEILSLQILITAVIGIMAIAGLYFGGQWVLQKNYSRWALQWTEELHELGAPLYLPGDEAVSLRLESYIDRYPEIERVTYFRLDGTAITSLAHKNTGQVDTDFSMSFEQLARVSELVGTERPYLMQSTLINVRSFEIFAPIWTESIANDGLFDFDPLARQDGNPIELVGFVGLQLDFTGFHDNLVGNIKLASIALLVLLVVSGFIGRLSLRRALRAISDLQDPIAELAKGNLDVRFKPAAHREISDIVEALETTAKELGERDARLLKLANHDALTGLINRRRFVEELEQTISDASRSRSKGALLFIDLDQ